MFRLAAVFALIAAPVSATTCQEYEDLIRAEGVRTLIALECVSEADAAALPDHWNAVMDTPAGACAISRSISAEPAALAFMGYAREMNAQRRAMDCPPPAHPLARQP
jgi:hypothetical protein